LLGLHVKLSFNKGGMKYATGHHHMKHQLEKTALGKSGNTVTTDLT
jgi:hypothetical protein